jgi:hypothetical protein
MLADPENKPRTRKWEEHVENALPRPVAVGNLRMVEMILLYDPSISIKGTTPNNVATA